jgi:hypothetical protein
LKALLSIKDFDGINIYGRIAFSYWQISFFIGRFMGRLWADYGQIICGTWRNAKNRTRRNAMQIVADYWRIEYYGRIKLFMGGSNYLWVDELSLTELINIMEKPLLKLVGVALRPEVNPPKNKTDIPVSLH